MTHEQTAFMIKSVLGLFCWTWMTLLGFRIVGPKPGKNLTYDAWFKKHGWWFQLGGPILILGNLGLMMLEISRW